jgi:uncharacterized SAM-binding protein YcdF (DUF218 family)
LRPARRGLRNAALTLCLLLVLGLVFHTRLLTAAGGFLEVSQPPQKADIAFVLGGDSYGHRILTAADLVRKGYVPKAMISGPGGVYGFHESDLAIKFAENEGYPENYFVAFPHNALSTAEEAQVAVKEFRRLQIHRILLVTSNYHTRRARNIFHAAGPELEFIPIGAPDEYFRPDTWWQQREGRKTFILEWMKTVAAWLKM